MSIQPGNLIKTTRAAVDCPEGTVGLITEHHSVLGGGGHRIVVYVVKLHGIGNTRRFLEQDLEVLSEATL